LVTQLIKPLGVPAYTEPDHNVPIESQLPSAIALSRDLVLTANGVGDIELIGLEQTQSGVLGTSLASVCYLGTGEEGVSPVPCVLLAARQVKSKIIMVVYSRAAVKDKSTQFNIATLEMNVPTQETERLEDGSFVLLLNTLHIQTGFEVPVYCAITSSGQRIILGSETKYRNSQDEEEEEEEKEEVQPMDIVPQNNEYQWSQDGADITVQFQLPANTPKVSINCKFVMDHLSLLIQNTTITYPYRKLWSTIRPDDCTWTLEEGLLTLFITKSDEHTRWPQLFDKDDGVLETLTTEQLSNIKASIDRLQQKEAHPVQHPAATDMDEDIDDVGQTIYFSVYDNKTGKQCDEFHSGGYNWICASFATDAMPSVCLQMDVDGLVFTFTEQGPTVQIEHVATFDAFGFVQASKRDARFIRHDPVFNFASIIESNRNAYIYYHHQDKRLEEVQTLVDLTKGQNVDIIGVQLVLENTLMILTESNLIVMNL
jgi:hypothetical protein